MKNIVMLVDNKARDLDVAALIAHHLQAKGIDCHIEPLEAYRAVLSAYRPELIIFNHLTASHLVEWSKRLAEIGVLTAVLPNEGIFYDHDVLQFNAGRHHNGAHIDYFFCWNEPHRQALLANGFSHGTRVETVGVPRFDFYFEPWSRAVHRAWAKGGRPRLLFATNFTTARHFELPRSESDKLFAPWAGRIPLYTDYWPAVEAHWRARNRALDYLTALAAAGEYDIVLRPHPGEDAAFYARWLDSLPKDQRSAVRLEVGGSITGLILDCDIELSCETCTTALESWIAGKPTIELIFERHPLWFREVQSRGNVECDDPEKLTRMVDEALRDPAQPEKREIRKAHLAKWCSSPDGTSSLRIAKSVADAVHGKSPADWSKLKVNDYRRGIKLQTARKFGRAYHYDPFLPVKRTLFGKRYVMKDYGYRKSVEPKDVRETRARILRALAGADTPG
jgi:surface carbohydrate biosynthesis protein